MDFKEASWFSCLWATKGQVAFDVPTPCPWSSLQQPLSLGIGFPMLLLCVPMCWDKDSIKSFRKPQEQPKEQLMGCLQRVVGL